MAYCLAVLVLWASASTLEAVANSAELGMHVASKSEVMASMTAEKALKTFARMETKKKTLELVHMVQQKMGVESSRKGHRKSALMQATLRGVVTTVTAQQNLESATKMLNDMIHETGVNLEIETAKCENDKTQQEGTMSTLRQQVASFNSEAAGARGRVVSAQGEIATLEANIDRERTTLKEFNVTCTSDISQMRYELAIILGDVTVMNTVLEKIGTCEDPSTTTTATNGFLLLQCPGCGVMLQHAPIQHLLGGLQSSTARVALKDNLNDAFDQDSDEEPVALNQKDTQHALLTTETTTTTTWPLHTRDVPESPEPQGCKQQTSSCIPGTKNCIKLRDRFIMVQSGIVDQKNELMDQLRMKENHCESQQKSLTELLEGMAEKLRVENDNLATGTEDQNTAEAGSHTNAEQHEAAVTEYVKSQKTCCKNKNTMISEICALNKIRAEVNTKDEERTIISDCEVTDWQPGECSARCGGGTRKDTRTVIAHPRLGNPCPPLEQEMSCNTHQCPVDCIVDEWSSWSECSAECGGGVMERSRHETRKAEFEGEVCPSLEEEISCGSGACNRNCELSDWSDWGESPCSRACGGGTRRSVRGVPEGKEAIGTGKCWEPDHKKRLKFKTCNSRSCTKMLRNLNGANEKKSKFLECDSIIDLTIVMDGSGSLGQTGWDLSKRLVKKLIQNLSPNVQVSLLLFSGPDTWDGVDKCLGGDSNLDMKTDCRQDWVSEYTSEFTELVTKVEGLTWPKGGTLTSLALGMVDADLMSGRIGAEPKVVVLTDGKPLSKLNTYAAAHKLQKSADVIWVPIGSNAPLEEIKQMASKPQDDHVIAISSFWKLNRKFNSFVNQILTTTCPKVIRGKID